jgi:hypothetical protein
MIGALTSLLVFVVLGYPFVRVVVPHAGRLATLGISFLFGTGIAATSLLLLSLIGVAWSTPALATTLSIVWISGLLIARNRGPLVPAHDRAPKRDLFHWIALVADACTFLLLAAFARFATLAAPWEWDFWAIWGLKAKVFWYAHGIDRAFLTGPNTSSWPFHPEYPLLLPLTFDTMALLGGGWDDRWFGLLFVGWASAAILIIRAALAEHARPALAALGTLAIAFLVFPRQTGFAEGPMVAFGTAGLLYLRRYTLKDDRRDLTLAAVLFGFASVTKNEGLLLLGAAAIALLLTKRSWRPVISLWPALPLPLVWLAYRIYFNLQGDLQTGDFGSRAIERLRDGGKLFGYLYRYVPGRTWTWLAVATIAFVVARPAIVRREQTLLVAIALQLAAYVWAYAITPHSLQWQVGTSWERLLSHVTLAFGFIAVALVLQTIEGERVT